MKVIERTPRPIRVCTTLPEDRDGATIETETRQAGCRVDTKGDVMAVPSETPVLDLLSTMTEASIAASSLDSRSLMLVRIAALVAVDAPPASYLLNLDAASEQDIDVDEVRGVLAAIAPIVGTARVASATGKIVEALAIELEASEQA